MAVLFLTFWRKSIAEYIGWHTESIALVATTYIYMIIDPQKVYSDNILNSDRKVYETKERSSV